MRVPHVINPVVSKVYRPSGTALQLKDEIKRLIRTDNMLWISSEVETLVTLSVMAIADSFEKQPSIIFKLPSQDKDHLVQILSTKLPLELVIPLITDEIYWKRRFYSCFGKIIESKHPNQTWKCAFIERHVQKLCEEAEPQYKDEYELNNLLKLCVPYVHLLRIRQMTHWSPSRITAKEDIPRVHPITHINFLPILNYLSNILFFEIQFGMREVGMDYSTHMFEIDVEDLKNLAIAVCRLNSLRILKIHRSNIGDEHIKYFARHMINNRSIQELNLSYCKIGDDGAIYLAELMTELFQLKILILRCNNIGPKGANGIAFALAGPKSCYINKLDLSLNPLGNKGIMPICSALLRCPIPQELCVRGCDIFGPTAISVATVLQYNTTLIALDISLNNFGEESGKTMIYALQKNYNLLMVDTRETGMTKETQAEIKQLLKRNLDIIVHEQKKEQEKESRRISIYSSNASRTSSLSLSMLYSDYDTHLWYSNMDFN